MNISSLPNVQTQNLFSMLGTNSSSGSNSSSSLSSLLQDPSPQLSSTSNFLNMLQQLQTQNPAKFQQMTQNLATRLQHEAAQATSDGDTTQAAALTKLANDFQTASKTGQMPPADQLQTDMSAVRHGHGHHHHGGGASMQSLTGQYTSNLSNTNADVLSTLFSSTASM